MPQFANSMQAESNLPALRVLLVDDEEDVLRVMQLILESRGHYQVEAVSSGEQALDKAEEFAPHVVISDLSMPDMQGNELLDLLQHKTSLTPFKSIALSGYNSDYSETPAGAEFDSHLTKPVDFEILFQTVDQLGRELPEECF